MDRISYYWRNATAEAVGEKHGVSEAQLKQIAPRRCRLGSLGEAYLAAASELSPARGDADPIRIRNHRDKKPNNHLTDLEAYTRN